MKRVRRLRLRLSLRDAWVGFSMDKMPSLFKRWRLCLVPFLPLVYTSILVDERIPAVRRVLVGGKDALECSKCGFLTRESAPPLWDMSELCGCEVKYE